MAHLLKGVSSASKAQMTTMLENILKYKGPPNHQNHQTMVVNLYLTLQQSSAAAAQALLEHPKFIDVMLPRIEEAEAHHKVMDMFNGVLHLMFAKIPAFNPKKPAPYHDKAVKTLAYLFRHFCHNSQNYYNHCECLWKQEHLFKPGSRTLCFDGTAGGRWTNENMFAQQYETYDMLMLAFRAALTHFGTSPEGLESINTALTPLEEAPEDFKFHVDEFDQRGGYRYDLDVYTAMWNFLYAVSRPVNIRGNIHHLPEQETCDLLELFLILVDNRIQWDYMEECNSSTQLPDSKPGDRKYSCPKSFPQLLCTIFSNTNSPRTNSFALTYRALSAMMPKPNEPADVTYFTLQEYHQPHNNMFRVVARAIVKFKDFWSIPSAYTMTPLIYCNVLMGLNRGDEQWLAIADAALGSGFVRQVHATFWKAKDVALPPQRGQLPTTPLSHMQTLLQTWLCLTDPDYMMAAIKYKDEWIPDAERPEDEEDDEFGIGPIHIEPPEEAEEREKQRKEQREVLQNQYNVIIAADYKDIPARKPALVNRWCASIFKETTLTDGSTTTLYDQIKEMAKKGAAYKPVLKWLDVYQQRETDLGAQ